MVILVIVTLLVGGGTSSCANDDTASPPRDTSTLLEVSDVDVANALLVFDSALPHRAEVVALSDKLSIAAAHQTDSVERIRLTQLAAALRERIWRLDHANADAHEAIELLGSVVKLAVGKAASCEADLRRAVMIGAVARDARQSYRELYLAVQRQHATSDVDGQRKSCLEDMGRRLELCEAFRPTGEAWQKLVSEGQRQADLQQQRSLSPSTSEDPSTAELAGVGSAKGLPAGKLLAHGAQDAVVIAPDASMVSGKAKLLEAQPYSWEQGGRLVLTLSEPARYQVGMLAPDPAAGRGHRLFLDLAGVRLKRRVKDVVSDGLIQSVRFGKRREGLRVVVDLKTSAFRRVFYLPDPFRVVIDLSTRAPARAAPTERSGKRSVRRVVLDPGHGGWDDGAVGPTGLREKDVVLDIAHRAAPALASELGIETMLTRDVDAFIPLEERTARANAYHADLFISVHCNATENGEAEGVELYFLDPSREMDAWSMRAVKRENLARRKPGKGSHHKHETDPAQVDAQVAQIAAGLQVGDVTQRSRLFAELLNRSTLSALSYLYPNTEDHGIKTAGFYVLLGAEMPAVLYETSFISNSGDEARLARADYRQRMADSIVNAVKAYRDGVTR